MLQEYFCENDKRESIWEGGSEYCSLQNPHYHGNGNITILSRLRPGLLLLRCYMKTKYLKYHMRMGIMVVLPLLPNKRLLLIFYANMQKIAVAFPLHLFSGSSHVV